MCTLIMHLGSSRQNRYKLLQGCSGQSSVPVVFCASSCNYRHQLLQHREHRLGAQSGNSISCTHSRNDAAVRVINLRQQLTVVCIYKTHQIFCFEKKLSGL